MPPFARPDQAARLRVSEGMVRDSAANCIMLYEREISEKSLEAISSSGLTDEASQ